MARDLTVAAETAVTAEVVYRAMAVRLAYDSGSVLLANTTFDFDIDGDTFLGVGQLGRIDAVEESADLGATTLKLGLTGIPRDMITTALTEPYQNRAATVYEVPLDADLVPVADPIVLFRGRMDTMRATIAAGLASVELTVTNRLVDWERPRRVLFSDDEQQVRNAGDNGFRYANAMETLEVVWPTKLYFEKVVGRG